MHNAEGFQFPWKNVFPKRRQSMAAGLVSVKEFEFLGGFTVEKESRVVPYSF